MRTGGSDLLAFRTKQLFVVALIAVPECLFIQGTVPACPLEHFHARTLRTCCDAGDQTKSARSSSLTSIPHTSGPDPSMCRNDFLANIEKRQCLISDFGNMTILHESLPLVVVMRDHVMTRQ
jgi:hypothetical protein